MEVCDLLARFRENWKYMKRHRSHTIDCTCMPLCLGLFNLQVYQSRSRSATLRVYALLGRLDLLILSIMRRGSFAT